MYRSFAAHVRSSGLLPQWSLFHATTQSGWAFPLRCSSSGSSGSNSSGSSSGSSSSSSSSSAAWSAEGGGGGRGSPAVAYGQRGLVPVAGRHPQPPVIRRGEAEEVHPRARRNWAHLRQGKWPLPCPIRSVSVGKWGLGSAGGGGQMAALRHRSARHLGAAKQTTHVNSMLFFSYIFPLELYIINSHYNWYDELLNSNK